jgi:hypothetical protein
MPDKNKISKKDKKKYPYIEAYAKEGIAPSDYKNVIKSGTFNPRTDTAVVAEGKYTKDHRRFKDHFQKRIDKKVNNNFTEAVSSSGNKNTTKLSGYRDDPFVKKSEFGPISVNRNSPGIESDVYVRSFKKSTTPLYAKISDSCKAAAKRKFKVWPSAYASGWGVQCTKAGGPSNFGGKKKKK